jgi:hypothetical protein
LQILHHPRVYLCVGLWCLLVGACSCGAWVNGSQTSVALFSGHRPLGPRKDGWGFTYYTLFAHSSFASSFSRPTSDYIRRFFLLFSTLQGRNQPISDNVLSEHEETSILVGCSPSVVSRFAFHDYHFLISFRHFMNHYSATIENQRGIGGTGSGYYSDTVAGSWLSLHTPMRKGPERQC